MRATRLTVALLAAGLAMPPVMAAEAVTLEKLLARLETLEARNAELEKEVKSLKAGNDRVTQALDSERISENEPELIARLKAVEKEALSMKKSTKKIDALDGLKAGASLATVVQTPHGLPGGTQDSNSQLNYRADVTLELPLKPLGDVEQKLFAHFRLGQGLGLNAAVSRLGTFASAPNGLAFRASGANADDSVAILGEAWYQAAIPLPFGGFKTRSRETLELTFGKMDIFGFFDQNAVAGDEAKQFLNTAFVHNPLLDAGREAGVDANGFQPGVVAAYVNKTDKSEPWRLALGVFGAGARGADYQRSLSAPLLIVQAEKQLRLFGGLAGNYRAYAWNRSEVLELDGLSTGRHSGIGLSLNQRVSDGISVFARYGKLVKGQLPFNQALAAGAEINGGAWGRGGDTVGLAASWLNSSSDYRQRGGSGDLTGDGSGTFSYLPAGTEKLAEIYYRYHISPQFDLSPDLQWIVRPGANPEAKAIKILGLRANLNF